MKPGHIEPEFGRIYTRARQAREEQDYDLDAAPLPPEDAEQIVSEAERFVARTERYLHEAGAIAE